MNSLAWTIHADTESLRGEHDMTFVRTDNPKLGQLIRQ